MSFVSSSRWLSITISNWCLVVQMEVCIVFRNVVSSERGSERERIHAVNVSYPSTL
jgi:hypothetical protein